ncbi:hypothetical protein IMSAGC021_01663 [Muribaculaceae bacterium]|nr:hypothetical protein IMSAGC021_01663 [Muribaculaceae bacterium]
MVDLRAAVSHVVNRRGDILICVSNLNKTLDAVILKRCCNLTVRSTHLNGLDRLAATVGMRCLLVAERVGNCRYKSIGTIVKRIFGSCLRIIGKFHAQRTVENVINSPCGVDIIKRGAERCLAAHTLGCRVVSLSNTTESVIDIPSADNHHRLVGCARAFGCGRYDTVFLDLHGSPETVNESDSLKVVTRMLDVVVLGHSVCRSGYAGFSELCLRLVLKRDDIGNTGCKLIRSAYLGNTTHVVNLCLVVEIVQIAAFKGDAIAVVEIAGLASVAPRIVYTLDIHVHLRLIAVLVPHTLARGICREGLLRYVAVTVILVVCHRSAVAELL